MLFAEPGTEREGGRWRAKLCGHWAVAPQLDCKGSAALFTDTGGRQRSTTPPCRDCVNKANSANIWVCIVWLHCSYCDPCYSGILQNLTNSHKSFAEEINITVQRSWWGEKESFKQLAGPHSDSAAGGAASWVGLPRHPHLPPVTAPTRPHGLGSSARGPGRGHCGTTSICQGKKGSVLPYVSRSSSFWKRCWPAARCVFPGLPQWALLSILHFCVL